MGSTLNKIPNLVAVACFLAGRVKDLLAPPHTGNLQYILHIARTFVGVILITTSGGAVD